MVTRDDVRRISYEALVDAARGSAVVYREMFVNPTLHPALPYGELLAPFGLDARDPAFWQIGLNMIEGMIVELEAMEG